METFKFFIYYCILMLRNEAKVEGQYESRGRESDIRRI